MPEVILLFVFSVLAFVSRVINLTNIPIFTDEAIYIRWAQIGLADPAHRFIALTDGKQPLLTWLMYPLLMIFQDPLFAGRLVSVLSSIGSVIGIYFIGKTLFEKKTAFFASFIYLISPFTMLYDRLALMDGLLFMLGIWSMYLSILLVRLVRLDVSLILGMVIGFGILTKSSAFFFLYLLPFSLLLSAWKVKTRVKNLLKWSCLALLSFVIAQVMYNILRLSPWFYLIRQKNYSFIFTVDEFLKAPFQWFLSNLNGLLPMLLAYLSIPVALIIIVGLIRGFLAKDKRIAYLFLWFLLPFLSLAAFGKIIYPRFFLFMTMPLYIIAAVQLAWMYSIVKNKILLGFIFLVLLFYPTYQSLLIVVNPIEVNIPQTDRNQLFDDWPSGAGVKDVIDFIEKQSHQGKVVIGTEGTFGLFPYAFQIYLGTNKNVEIYDFWPVSSVPQILIEKAKYYPTYLVFKEKQVIPSDWPLEFVSKRKRGKRDNYLLLYQVKAKQ